MCTSGTVCTVPGTVPIGDGQEMSWELKVLTITGNQGVVGYKVCLAGRA